MSNLPSVPDAHEDLTQARRGVILLASQKLAVEHALQFGLRPSDPEVADTLVALQQAEALVLSCRLALERAEQAAQLALMQAQPSHDELAAQRLDWAKVHRVDLYQQYESAQYAADTAHVANHDRARATLRHAEHNILVAFNRALLLPTGAP